MDGFQQLFVIAGIFASLAAALWALRQRGLIQFSKLKLGNSSQRHLQIVERLQLTPQHSLCLVRLEDRTLLIGTAPSSCHLLDQKGEL